MGPPVAGEVYYPNYPNAILGAIRIIFTVSGILFCVSHRFRPWIFAVLRLRDAEGCTMAVDGDGGNRYPHGSNAD